MLRLSFWMGKCAYGTGPGPITTLRTYNASSTGDVLKGFWERFFEPESEFGSTEFSLWPTTDMGRPTSTKDGLYEKFGARLYDFMQKTKKEKFKVRLTELDIINIDNTAKYKIGPNFYYLDALRGSFPCAGVSDVDMYWVHPSTYHVAAPALPANRMLFSESPMSEEDLNAALGITVENYQVVGLNVYFDGPGGSFTVSENAFSDNVSILEVDFPECTIFSDSAFSGCTSIVSFSAENVEEMEGGVLHGCTGIVSLSFPNLLTTGASCFRGCTSLQVISIPLCTLLAFRSFKGCTSLVTIYAPVASMGETVLNDDIFTDANVSSCTMTIPVSMATCNGGSPDADVDVFVSNGGTVVYV